MTGTVDGSAEQEKISFGTVAIEFARLRFRKLSGDGIRIYPGSKPQQIRSDQVETAMKFLKLLRPTKKPTIGSGTLKHLAEDWGNDVGLCAYVSRGAMTAAAVACGFTVQAFKQGPHVSIGINRRDLAMMSASLRRKE